MLNHLSLGEVCPLLPHGLAEVLGDAHVALLEVVRPPQHGLAVPGYQQLNARQTVQRCTETFNAIISTIKSRYLLSTVYCSSFIIFLLEVLKCDNDRSSSRYCGPDVISARLNMWVNAHLA